MLSGEGPGSSLVDLQYRTAPLNGLGKRSIQRGCLLFYVVLPGMLNTLS